MDDALSGAKAAGWTGKIGADADHLKTPADVDITSAVGFTFYTIDPSGEVDQKADDYHEAVLRDKFATARESAPWYEGYLGKSIDLSTGTKIQLTEEACMRAAVKYGAAIKKALSLGDHIRKVNEAADQPYEIELSVDETDQPTTLAEHYIIAHQCLEGGMKLVSLAPRFIGELEKGVDYKGDVPRLEASLNDHAAIADLLGPYKLSLHSGSDKLSMYAALARATKGKFHVSGMSFAMFFLAEYANMLLVSTLCVIMFLGGWLPPIDAVLLNWIPGWIWLAIKVFVVVTMFLWVRSTFPRYRYDQIMRLGWKIFIPVTLIWLVVVGAWIQSPWTIWL
jgi:hypothetical protein